MNVTLEEQTSWLAAEESEHIEFKKTKRDFDSSRLVKYCAALANEGGGRRGLDRGASKALLLQHIEQNARDGSPLAELNQVLPGIKPTQVQNFLRELKRDGKAHPEGKTKGARWFPGPPADSSS